MPAKKSSPAKKLAVLVTLIERRIYLIRGQKVMIDSDLAELYGVETKILNRGVRRNLERFPENFMFQLTKDEAESLRIQFGTLKPAGRGQHRVGGFDRVSDPDALQTPVVYLYFERLQEWLEGEKPEQQNRGEIITASD
jgi:hypothetical protein